MFSPLPLTSSSSSIPSQPWPLMPTDLHNLQHLLQNSSVTLSPAHSEQSGGSPRHPDSASTTSNNSAVGGYPHSGGHSDSEDSTKDDSSSPQRSPIPSGPQQNISAQALASFQQMSEYQRAAVAAAAAAAAAQAKHEGAQHKYQLQQMIHKQQSHSRPWGGPALTHNQPESAPHPTTAAHPP